MTRLSGLTVLQLRKRPGQQIRLVRADLELRLRCSQSVSFFERRPGLVWMHGDRTNIPTNPSPLRTRIANLFVEGDASLRLGYAIGLGSAGLIALVLVTLVSLERQVTTSPVAGMTPLDAQHRGYFLVDPAVEPIAAVTTMPRLEGDELLWFAMLTLVAGIGLAAWQIAARQRRARTIGHSDFAAPDRAICPRHGGQATGIARRASR